MSRARNLLQAAVLHTNPIWPFSYLNKVPYRVALGSFQRLCRSFPEICSVYLIHGMTEENNWLPGLSDIDLIVTFSGELSRDDEFAFLTKFRGKHASLRTRFPMLKDVLLLNHNHLGVWTRCGISGFEAPRWKTLLGTPPVCAYKQSSPSADAIDDALYRFFEILVVWYCEPPTYITLQRMRRLASRILRHAPEFLRKSCSFRTEDPTLLVAHVLLHLDKWIRDFEQPSSDSISSDEDSICIRESFCLFVPGSLDMESLKKTLLRLRHRAQSGMRVQIATASILRYWLRVWNPRLYHDWIASGRSERGPNVLSHVQLPDQKAYTRSLLNLTSSILSFPHLEEVILQSQQAWFAGEAFRWLALRGWYLRLYLEKSIQWPMQRQTIDEIHRNYPNQVAELAAINKLAVTAGSALYDLRYRAFCLLKETAVAVSSALTSTAAAYIRCDELVGT